MAKIVFSSDDLPPGLAGAERYALWRGIFHDAIGGVDVGASQAPFEGHATFGIFNDVVIGDLRGTLNSSRQSARAAPASAGGRLALMVNLGAGNIRSVHRGRDEALAAQGAMLVSRGADGVMNSIEDYNAWCLIDLPDRALARAVPRAEDMLGLPLMGRSEPLAMLTRYAGMVLAADAPTDCHLQAHIAQTTIDLVALALGAEREEAVEARGRGLKTARIAAILREITAGFADAEFTVADVAAKLRLSERTIQDLLQETGEGFASRVLQLRLQFAAKLLAGPGSAARKISDIANASGFNDLSYFHRCYRRRFGMTPAGSKGATSRIGIERFQ